MAPGGGGVGARPVDRPLVVVLVDVVELVLGAAR